ncbi:MAG: acetyl-CoA carboxylase carboxyltransferase subunit alpha [Chloroflexota bacterium]|nr:acetyl-CoA carboxylase carboxyltransferase subunit alpha [Chloroflexota bacterium]
MVEQRTAASVAVVEPTPDELRSAIWARVQQARNVKRPHTLELIQSIATEVIELHGDRLFRDDPAIVGGFCRIDGRRAVFVGHQKGAETDENIRRNFGMPHPEGYRKAIRLFRLAERLGLPIVTFIDTPGAFPGPASEERGVAEAIARAIMTMCGLRTPIVTVITGEGGSGGALALAVGDVVLALENSIYSVISPEGAASILWRSAEYSQQAAAAMRLTAAEQLALGVIDEVVPEPPGGAHTNPEETARRLRARIAAHLDALAGRERKALLDARYARYRNMGEFAIAAESGEAQPQRPGLRARIRRVLDAGRNALVGGEGETNDPTADSTDEADVQRTGEGS